MPVLFAVPIGQAPVRGPPDALITIVEYADFQSLYCARVLPTLQQVREKYGENLRLVFKHDPLPLHRHARPAAEAALAAGEQGRFWEMHDRLFSHQPHLARADLERDAQELGLDLNRFRAALDFHQFDEAIDRDIAEAASLGVEEVPAFFINGCLLIGARAFEKFDELVSGERQRALALLDQGVSRAQLYEALLTDAGA